MVLPQAITQPLVGAIPAIHNFNAAVGEGSGSRAGAGPTFRTMHNHIRVNVTNSGGKMSTDEITAAVQRGIRKGSLSL